MKLLLSSDVLKTGTVVIVPVYKFRPHRCGTDPQTMFSVERPVDDHGLHGLGVGGNADQFVFFTFEVAVSACF